jgi:hypothetical protein
MKFRKAILPHWSSYLGIEEELAIKMWNYVRGNFFAQLTSKGMSHEYIYSTVSEAKILIKALQAEQDPYLE